MKKIVFVCTGNTCRSPMAQGMFNSLCTKKNITDIEVVSRGIYCSDNEPASENAVAVMSEHGIDISNHRSKMISSDDFSQNSIFVCMTNEQANKILKMNRTARLYVLNVSDPFGADISAYRKTANEIEKQFDDIFEILNEEIYISPMKKEDIPHLARLERENFSLPWSEKSLLEELENPNARFFTAKLNNEPIGYIGSFNVCGEVSISSIVVSRELRNRGIGNKLLSKLEDVSREEKAEFITLEVRLTNEIAQSLYIKNGYEKVGIRKGFYEKPKEDAILMTKYLK